MKRHSNVIDLSLYRLRRLAQSGQDGALFDAVAREQRQRDANRELMRRACARAAEKAAAKRDDR